MKLLARAARRLFPLFTRPIDIHPVGPASFTPQHEFVDEEASPAYNPRHFYPAKPGETLANHYQLLVKIGWGTRSTVWLAKDISRYKWQPDRFVALKLINNRSSHDAQNELDIEKRIARDPSHRGHLIMRTCLESFEVSGPEGSHLCLIYESMREPLWILQKRFIDKKLPLSIAKAYIVILLTGLDYLHSKCRIVHTDLKLENILMTFENENILPNFIRAQTTSMPMQGKTHPETGQIVYRCHNDFGPLNWRELRRMYPKIADFGLATHLKSNSRTREDADVGVHPIQPDHYRAPEVILGCGWDFSTDIWNMGVLIWNIIEGTDLFQQAHNAQGCYDSKAHPAEMIALLGPPPRKLLARSDAMSQHRWPNSIINEAGKLCGNSREYFNGPFFNENGGFLHNDLIPDRKLDDTVPSLEQDEKQAFLSFVNHLLRWCPEERKSARELLTHPFLKF